MEKTSIFVVIFRLWAFVALPVALLLSSSISWGATGPLETPSQEQFSAAGAQLANQHSPSFHTGSGPAAIQSPDYRLGSGDHVRVTVFGEDDLTGEYAVDGKGSLSFPLIGRVAAGGLTADALARALEGRLSPSYIKDPHVSVEILSYRPFYIMGEVKTPGSYSYVSGMTVINAVALAGGFTYRARDDQFVLARSGKDGRREDIEATPETPVEPGDVITVRERYF